MPPHKIADFLLNTRLGLRFAERLNHSLSRHLLRMQKNLARKISPQWAIMDGPFRDMRYGGGEKILGSSILPKIVGSYEEELHGSLADIMKRPYVTGAEGCTSEQLCQAATGATYLILSDCEGAEDSLLHSSTLPASAAQCDLLIEAHDTHARPDMASTLVERFHATHDATILGGASRQSEKYASLRGLNQAETDMALNEYQPFFMKWAFLRQKPSPTS